MPAGWAEELHARWPHLRLFNCYGLTEFTSVSHLLTPEHAIARGETVGRPVAGVRQQVVGEDGRPLPSGEPGEVWLSGPMRMQGYWGAEQATGEVFRGDWLRTGDLGAVDGDGFLTLLGRSAEVITRGGEKVHVAQVEAALCRLESVAEAAVVGAPHPVLQEAVVACVVLRRGHELDQENARDDHRAARARIRLPGAVRRARRAAAQPGRQARSPPVAGLGRPARRGPVVTGNAPASPASPPDTSRARQIRAVAAELFFTRGYEAATLRDIARGARAQVGKPLLLLPGQGVHPLRHRQLDDGRAHGRRRGGCSPRSPRPS